MKHGFTQRPTSFFITAPLPCPYLEGRVERRMVTELLGRDAVSLHDTLSKVGFSGATDWSMHLFARIVQSVWRFALW